MLVKKPIIKPSKLPKPREAILHEDGKWRCPWPGQDPLYVTYHDTEWGVPVYDSRALFEKLILDGFQAGLSWITILRKREAFIAAFDGFIPARMADFDERKIDSLMENTAIVRNRAKIVAAIRAAQIYCDMDGDKNFAPLIWHPMGDRPRQNHFKTTADIPTQSPEAEALSATLRKCGFNFVGPTIVYAFMQAVGMVNDHLVSCFRHGECAKLG